MRRRTALPLLLVPWLLGTATLGADTPLTLFELETPGQPTEYRIGLQNFYVLTRYNRSSLYASAVFDLAEALRSAARPVATLLPVSAPVLPPSPVSRTN